MRFRSGVALSIPLALSITLAACGQSIVIVDAGLDVRSDGAEASSDAHQDVANAQDRSDVLDVVEAHDTSEEPDVIDAHDANEAIDVIDASDAEDALDVVETVDGPGDTDAATDSADGCEADAPCEGIVCHGVCVSSSADHCGPSCMPCVRPDGGDVDCIEGVCQTSCPPGSLLSSGTCEPAPAPRLVHPMTNSRMTVRDPTLRWALPTGVDAVRIRICSDRPCATVELEFDATGTSARIPRELTSGAWFWNARSVTGGGASTLVSATWSFHAAAASRSAESAWASRPDVNGDGFDDVVVSAEWDDAVNAAHVFAGNAANVVPTGCTIAASGGSSHAIPVFAGDVDGDGFSDIAIGSTDTSHRIDLFRGDSSGCAFESLATVRSSTSIPVYESNYYEASGDLDRDGYADMIFYSGEPVWARGSPTGWGAIEPFGADTDRSQGVAVLDLDGDGFDDVLTATSEIRWWHGSPAGPVGPISLGPSLLARNTRGGHPVNGVGDLDGDGYLDAVQIGESAAFGPGLAAIVIRGGAGGPTAESAQRILVFDPSAGSADYLGTAGDLDANGTLDLAVMWLIWQNRFDGILGLSSGYADTSVHNVTMPCPTGISAGILSMTRSVGDWNGDGLLDSVVICGAPPANTAWLLRATPGGWPTPEMIPAPSGATRGFGWFVM